MCPSWVIPSVAVVGVEFNSVVGSKVWDFCEGDLVVVYVDWDLVVRPERARILSNLSWGV